MAQGVLQQLLQRGGMSSVTVESAGVFAVSGMEATRETTRVLAAAGINCAQHRARLVTTAMIEQADLVFVMEQFQAEEIIRRAPKARDKVHLLKPHGLPTEALIGSPNIPDPIGKPMEVYEVCFHEVCEAVARVAKSLGVVNA